MALVIRHNSKGLKHSAAPKSLKVMSDTFCFPTVFGSYLWNRCTSWALPSMLLLSSASCCSDRQRLFNSYIKDIKQSTPNSIYATCLRSLC